VLNNIKQKQNKQLNHTGKVCFIGFELYSENLSVLYNSLSWLISWLETHPSRSLASSIFPKVKKKLFVFLLMKTLDKHEVVCFKKTNIDFHIVLKVN